MGEKKREWLIDVPVKYIIWTRPEFVKKGFSVIKEARPSKLFVVSDGPRTLEEKRLIEESRKIVEDIDWDCEVHRLYYESNNGMYNMMYLTGKYIFERVDRCIMLEDDNIPSISFFKYCKELLDYYENDLRIGIINGFNHLGVYDKNGYDYLFSKEGSIFGFAVWKRSYLPLLEMENGFEKNSYISSLAIKNSVSGSEFSARIKAVRKGYLYDGHIPGEEYYQSYLSYIQNQLYVVPSYNLISNIGCTSDGTHTTELKKMAKGRHQIFCTKTYELKFPLKHPKYVIPDTFYDKKRNRIMALGHPIIFFYRKVVTALRMLIFGDYKVVIKKAHNKLKRIRTKGVVEG